VALWRWLVRVFLGAKFVKIAVEFLTEAAVLVSVFPVLDYFIKQGVMDRAGWALAAWSSGIAAVLFILAAILSQYTD
jgi:hypothetical protein